MDKDYIRHYCNLESNHWWFIVRKKIILQRLRKYIPHSSADPLKILNVGAASGYSSKWLSEFGSVVSVENDHFFLQYLQEQQLPAVQASITDLPFDNDSFDLVCALDVIEHVEDDVLAMKELWRVCKPGGSLCITVPAFQSLWSSHDIINHHYRRYKKNNLRRLVEAEKPGKTVYCSYFNFLFFIPIFLIRKIGNLFGRKTTQDENADFKYFEYNKSVNFISEKIFSAELTLLRFMKFPFGVSIIMIARKNSSVNE